MPTISSMARNNYMMFKYAQNNGKSLFESSVSASKASALWSNPYSFQSTSAATMSGLFGIRSAMNDMVTSYDSASRAFKSELTSTMDDLSKASDSIKNMNFDVGGKSAVTETSNEDGTVTVAKSKELTDVLKGIEDFAGKYNDAVNFFQDNAGVSGHMKHMTNVFSDTTYRSGLLNTIGIVVENDGKMKIDEDVLTKALTENPSKVGRILGKGGLADKADAHVSFARSTQNRLFPSINSVLGSAAKSSSVYSGNSLLKLSSYSSVGNLLNTWI